ncbi:MAG TPA: M1 family aminopeptidase [Marmoricola sp.]|nr:M1 family aminopeptidase [Marmoricola sp.]
MGGRATVSLILSAALLGGGFAATPVASGAAAAPRPGSPGAGDAYFPLAGNGGYDVRHYGLRLRYRPAVDRLTGVAVISARATQGLTRFNLDLDGLRVHAVRVDGRRADWSRSRGELRVTPARVLRRGERFRVAVRYGGVPRTLANGPGFIHTDDGNIVAGQPEGASTWFPVNDHPSDKASYSFHVTVPKHRKVVANGELLGRHTSRGWTTWHWKAREPMAPYLATVDTGAWRLRGYRHQGIEMWDAIDPDLFRSVTPRTGERMAISQSSDSGYHRLTRRIRVPAAGATVSFSVTRDTESEWDHFVVEAHPVGSDEWTTLPDLNGHTDTFPGNACTYWQEIHPFLGHYQTVEGDECSPTGTTGAWHSASGRSDGYEQWTVDLAPWAGQEVELSLSVVSDDSVSMPGVFVDDITVSTSEGTTSFEEDADPMDGWTVPGAPVGSPGNAADWIVGTADDAPATPGEIARGSLRRQGEIIDFLESRFGPYPFSAGGGIVHDVPGLGFALETQTRPIYAPEFFTDPLSGDGVVVHEVAHQWYGDSLAVRRWRHIWLNEGFASYAEWLWSEHEGLGTAQEIFDFFYTQIPEDDEFWTIRIGDPGPANLFHNAVYTRGAMTLHQLRLLVGDRAFFSTLRRWARGNRNGLVTTRELIALAEQVSGRQLDRFFHRWVFTTTKPEVGTTRRAGADGLRSAPPVAKAQLRRLS